MPRKHKALMAATRTAPEIVGEIAAIIHKKELEKENRYPDNQEDADLWNMDTGMDLRRERD